MYFNHTMTLPLILGHITHCAVNSLKYTISKSNFKNDKIQQKILNN